ncbi:alpha-N-arabinofuranosidase [Halosimplex rubrum]|uniref:non-reducing end alpha-L-arabinofuranosidase n=1 Tax=Halosimplex rubrum TaxID=869889 RepID=A0A7D5T6T6_9EURY|nr:alpha-L-arabinofuranosidase C-terminal domain-containing protein [Halosimplex rubrum]QLH78433.1 alpha-N-arabinofuranosidase [Halosimplex rubrum]
MVDSDLLVHTETDDPSAARITVDANQRADFDVEPKLFGKFCEHLGNNIYQGKEAQILFNPTFGEWHFRGVERRPSGGFVSESDRERIEEKIQNHSRPLAYPPETDPDALFAAYEDALAFGWQPAGDVLTSPATGPSGNRAQRIQIDAAGDGVFQETRLPLHRVNDYEFRTQLRAADPTTARIAVVTDETVYDEIALEVGTEWATIEGTLELPDDVDPDGVYEIKLTADDPADLVVERLLLYPGDHVDYADPEVVEYLRESDLPLLRWPGGNFVSGYDWRDGVGPVDERPERINPAWDGLEPNLFGTAEFVQFCRHVGCEPSICVNAGDGTPEEAAKWVEYCNGDPEETEMGALRAEHGYPEPFDITYWEIGNELWGKWQVHWTTPQGNADRYHEFREAMLEADPDILVTACGVVANEDRPWNQVLLDECGEDVRAISSHPLAGGQVDGETDPDELYHAFMGYSDQLTDQYAELEKQMREAGVENPKLDVTELQLFASFNPGAEGAGRMDADDTDYAGESLTPETMPTPTTISEAIYNACMRHDLIRLGEFAELLTHSATVNHGGGLQKEGERVWADPCHYGRSIGTVQAGATPVTVELECDSIITETSFREIDPVDVPSIDAMATVDDGTLSVVVVNRASRGEPVSIALDFDGFEPANEATLTTLGSDALYDENTREEPELVTPDEDTLSVADGAAFDLPSYSMARIDFERA